VGSTTPVELLPQWRKPAGPVRYRTLAVSSSGWGTTGSPIRVPFHANIPTPTLVAMREVPDKAWVMGENRFHERIVTMLRQQATPKPRGGDRKSTLF